MIGTDELTTYESVVPSIGSSLGSPSMLGCGFMLVERFTVAVCGTAFAIRASWDCRVPGTDAFTFSTGLESGIPATSLGSSVAMMNVQGPFSDGPRYQRPEMSTYV